MSQRYICLRIHHWSKSWKLSAVWLDLVSAGVCPPLWPTKKTALGPSSRHCIMIIDPTSWLMLVGIAPSSPQHSLSHYMLNKRMLGILLAQHLLNQQVLGIFLI